MTGSIRRTNFNMASKSLKILVLDADCNAATCVVQSLGRAGHKISLAGERKEAISFRSRYIRDRRIYPSPLESRKVFLDWFMSTIGEGQFDYILPLSDVSLYPLREISPKRAEIILPPEDGFEWFFDKSRTIDLAERCGVPVPRSQVVLSSKEVDPGVLGPPPYFVKLTRSKIWIGDQGMDLAAHLARTVDDLTKAVDELSRFGPVLLQEYVPGVGVGIEMLCSNGVPLISFAHQRIHEYPLTGGGSSYRVSIDIPQSLFEAAKRLVEAAGWSGVVMVEFKMDSGRFSLMEVNGRFWGSLPLSYRSGIDFPKALIDLLEGIPVKGPFRYRTGIYSRRFSTDFAWFKRNLLSDKSDPYIKTRPVVRSFLEYGRFLFGRDHWDHAFLSDPMPFLSEIFQTFNNTSSALARMAKRRIIRKWGMGGSRERLKTLLDRPEFKERRMRILVLCYGNICRSPFVESLLKKELGPSFFDIKSCGFIEQEGRSSPKDYLDQTIKAGIDLSSHRSSAISQEWVSWADCILLMDFHNWESLRRLSPKALEKVLWLGAWKKNGQGEISDPYGKSLGEMEQIISCLKSVTLSLADDLKFLKEDIIQKK